MDIYFVPFFSVFSMLIDRNKKAMQSKILQGKTFVQQQVLAFSI